jgi:hypothetical protein
MEETGIMWELLTDNIDYHHNKWYEYVDHRWEICGKSRIFELLRKYAPGQDYEKIMKQFRWRDREAHARPRMA